MERPFHHHSLSRPLSKDIVCMIQGCGNGQLRSWRDGFETMVNAVMATHWAAVRRNEYISTEHRMERRSSRFTLPTTRQSGRGLRTFSHPYVVPTPRTITQSPSHPLSAHLSAVRNEAIRRGPMINTHVCSVAVSPDLLLAGRVASYAWITYNYRFFVH